MLLSKIAEDHMNSGSLSEDVLSAIKRQFPTASDREAEDIYLIVSAACQSTTQVKASLVLTAPPSFRVRTQSTKNTVEKMIDDAKQSILITGYSMSEYFDDTVEKIIKKSQEGVLIKFFVNDIESQPRFEKICRYKGRYLHIYNYKKSDDSMSALHAKVISTDKRFSLISSANLSYHGQIGNIELGTLIESNSLAKQLEEVFTELLFEKVFVEV